jgi:hypothetical protein
MKEKKNNKKKNQTLILNPNPKRTLKTLHLKPERKKLKSKENETSNLKTDPKNPRP